MNLPVILAIDYGTQRIGVAVSRGSLAEPLVVLENSPQLLTELRAVIHDEQVTQIIVGLSENEMAEKTRHFAAELQKYITQPIEFVDETLSSHTVHQKLREQPKRHHGPIDHLAAAEFLQEYLDGLH